MTALLAALAVLRLGPACAQVAARSAAGAAAAVPAAAGAAAGGLPGSPSPAPGLLPPLAGPGLPPGPAGGAPLRPAQVEFVQWSAGPAAAQDWRALRRAVARADFVVMNLAPFAREVLEAVSRGESSARSAARRLGGGPGAQDRFTAELSRALHGTGARVVNAETGGLDSSREDLAGLQALLDRARSSEAEGASAQAAGDFLEALRRLAAIHARQGADLLEAARRRALANPGRRIVVLERLPYTFEHARLRADGSVAGRVESARTFLVPLPLRFTPIEVVERKLLRGVAPTPADLRLGLKQLSQ